MFPQHVLVEFGGQLIDNGTADEIWACGVRCIDANSGGYTADPDEALNVMHQALAEWFAAPASGMSVRSTLTYLKINNINAAGHYASNETHAYYWGTPVPGGANQAAPAFCSVAMTWETGVTRGLAARGRIYPPNFTEAPNGSNISAAGRDRVRDAGYALLHDVIAGTTRAGDTEDMLVPSVVSGVGAGAHRPIIAVTCDDVYDVQRRRKNQTKSTRSAPSGNPQVS